MFIPLVPRIVDSVCRTQCLSCIRHRRLTLFISVLVRASSSRWLCLITRSLARFSICVCHKENLKLAENEPRVADLPCFTRLRLMEQRVDLISVHSS
jgi:hypothetical protein